MSFYFAFGHERRKPRDELRLSVGHPHLDGRLPKEGQQGLIFEQVEVRFQPTGVGEVSGTVEFIPEFGDVVTVDLVGIPGSDTGS